MRVLVAGDFGVDGARPGVDATGEGLSVGETLITQPHGDTEGTGSVMAHDDDGGVGIEFGVGSGGDFSHGHEDGVCDAGCLVLPRLANVQENRRVGLLALLGKGFYVDFGF
jgi:hypothetical protein